MCSVWISEQTAIISLYNINWPVFITDCVHCAVRTECLYIYICSVLFVSSPPLYLTQHISKTAHHSNITNASVSSCNIAPCPHQPGQRHVLAHCRHVCKTLFRSLHCTKYLQPRKQSEPALLLASQLSYSFPLTMAVFLA